MTVEIRVDVEGRLIDRLFVCLAIAIIVHPVAPLRGSWPHQWVGVITLRAPRVAVSIGVLVSEESVTVPIHALSAQLFGLWVNGGVLVMAISRYIDVALRRRAHRHGAVGVAVPITVAVEVPGGPIDGVVINGSVTVVIDTVTPLVAVCDAGGRWGWKRLIIWCRGLTAEERDYRQDTETRQQVKRSHGCLLASPSSRMDVYSERFKRCHGAYRGANQGNHALT
jgi:hypothetical protein